MRKTDTCFVCGGRDFSFSEVLWSELIQAWQLSQSEIGYINRQQGCSCSQCGSNLRSIALAKGIMASAGYCGFFSEFVESEQVSSIRVLEVNEAGSLSPFLAKLPKYRLVQYPDYDLMKLALDSESYDLVVHSDTLEHVEHPLVGLSESCRVLAGGGSCHFTIPIIVGRMTRYRAGLPKSFHGTNITAENDLVVHSEFGADFWTLVLQAGFSSCAIHCLEFPAGLSIEAQK